MICPQCKEDTVTEETCTNCQTHMVICSHCGFKTTLLEYNAWKAVHEKKPSRKKTVFHEREETFNMAEAYIKIGDLWNQIRTPVLIIMFVLMLALIIIVARR
jgi:hypothetical protein